MKVLVLLVMLSVALTACGPESSPEGRMTIKLTELKQEIDSLKTQNSQIKDSLGKVGNKVAQKKQIGVMPNIKFGITPIYNIYKSWIKLSYGPLRVVSNNIFHIRLC